MFENGETRALLIRDSRTSPFAIHAPSKPRDILAGQAQTGGVKNVVLVVDGSGWQGVYDVVPPLRERRDDILPLARQFLAGAAKRFGKKAPALATAPKRRNDQASAPQRCSGNSSRIGNNAVDTTLIGHDIL